MIRRTWGLEEINKDPDEWIWLEGSSMVNQGRFTFHNDKEDSILVIKCPYGGVGDRLWVKETWAVNPLTNMPMYKADFDKTYEKPIGGWKPSIFMPRKASRILLEITEVRVERLREITPEDCLAEGISRDWAGSALVASDADLVKRYQILWDSLNAKRGYGWDKNPWVWVVGFKMVLQSERK